MPREESIMNKSTLVTLSFLSAAGMAFAEGPLNYPDSDQAPSKATVSTLTRAEVIAEMFAARARGENAMGAEDSGSSYLAQLAYRDLMLARQAQRQLMAAKK
jgi:hypothetical protein